MPDVELIRNKLEKVAVSSALPLEATQRLVGSKTEATFRTFAAKRDGHEH